MRGTVAKRLRRLTAHYIAEGRVDYREGHTWVEQWCTTRGGRRVVRGLTLVCTGPRATYQQLKRTWKEWRRRGGRPSTRSRRPARRHR